MKQYRGYTLIMVLGVLLVLSIILTAVLVASGDQQVAGVTVMTQRLASNRADDIAQLAIARIKTGAINPLTMTPCTFPAVTANRPYLAAPWTAVGNICTSTTDVITDGLVSVAGDDLSNGQGIIGQWWIFRRTLPGGALGNARLLTVYAEGYYGVDMNSRNLTASSVVAEVLVPEPPTSGLTPDGDYGVFR
jgi:hypothetical protein